MLWLHLNKIHILHWQCVLRNKIFMKETIYIGITGNRDISNEKSIFIKKNIENFLKKLYAIFIEFIY